MKGNYKVGDIIFDIINNPNMPHYKLRFGVIVEVPKHSPHLYVVQFGTDIGKYRTLRYQHEIIPGTLNKFFTKLYGA